MAEGAAGGRAPGSAIPGPVDRVHFNDEQRRNRRASWRFSVFAAVTAVLSGLPLSVLLSPLVFGVLLLAAHAASLVLTLPPELWRTLEGISLAAPNLWTLLRGGDADVPWAALATLLVAPGAAVMLIAWIWIRLLFRRVGVGGVLHRLGARAPDRRVLEELQIVHIVEEMAIAAGVPAPRVLILDSAAANAAAVGLTVDDATILVSRGLLDLDRDSRQAILAHVIGSVSNGDLEIASVILSVMQTWGLLSLLLDTPFGPRSRRAVRAFVSTSRRAWKNDVDRPSAALMLDHLLDGAGLSFDDLMEHTDDAATMARHPLVAMLVDLPLYLTLGVGGVAAKGGTALFTLLVFGPWVALLWRARRRLADATAVQLTRHPDALARAVREMEKRDVAVEGGAAVSFLFPFWTRFSPDAPTRDDIMSHVLGTQLGLDDRIRSLWKLGATGDAAEATAAAQAGAPPRPPTEETTWRIVLMFSGWLVVAVLLVAACIGFNLATTSLLLWGEWILLGAIFGRS